MGESEVKRKGKKYNSNVISLFFVRKMQLQNSKQIKQNKKQTQTHVLKICTCIDAPCQCSQKVVLKESNKQKNQPNRCELIFTNRTQSNQNHQHLDIHERR